MMRLLHINCNYITTALHQTMIEHLEKYGVDSEVFVPVYTEKNAVVDKKANVLVKECFRKWDRIHFFRKQQKIFDSVQKAYSLEQFDCIHAYTLFTDGNCAYELSKKFSKPYVVAIRNTDVNVFLKYMVHLRKRGVEIMKNASAVFFLSPQYHKKVFEKYIPRELQAQILEKSFILPNGIDDFWKQNVPQEDLEARISRMKKNKHIKVIYAGRIDKNKNIPTTQSALNLLRERGYQVDFTVVGKIADEEEYQRIRKDQHTTYAEAQPKEALIGYYRSHDIFVMPSYTETFGLVYAEAMSQGLPVIYTRGEGFDGHFPEGKVGFAVSAVHAEEIAQACIRCVENYEQISRTCVAMAKCFDWNDICGRYVEIYHSISDKS